MTDQNFPIIEYDKNHSPKEWGRHHGEEFRVGINELYQIRKELMLAKNPRLDKNLKALALEQFEHTKNFSKDLANEMEHIATGANLNLEDLVILNNYTDFRDIQLPDEGCSTLHTQFKSHSVCGQTWDMHGSAKKYVCIIKVPSNEYNPNESLIFSLVGCLGLMGFNNKKLMIGVNNINTKDARSGIIWPALVRKVLFSNNMQEAVNTLTSAKVTSGHNYLLSTETEGQHWEITPTKKVLVSKIEAPHEKTIFHTNHCLSTEVQQIEDTESISSTTLQRYELLTNKVEKIRNVHDFEALLTDHDNYPKSICSHYQAASIDPSQTCGGGISDYSTNEIIYWRGCPTHDTNYIRYRFQLTQDKFIKV